MPARFAALLLTLLLAAPALAQSKDLPQFDGDRAFAYTRDFVAIGPRWIGSPGHLKAEEFLKKQFAHDQLEVDSFTAQTPVGPLQMRNYIVKFPGKKDGIIVLGSHYETNLPLRNIHYVGANDGGSSTGLLIELANYLRGHQNNGYSVYLVFFDGEEAIKQWSETDSLYGSKHLAAKWQADGTLKHIKAFLLADMIGDKDLDIQRDLYSTPWLEDLVQQAASKYGNQSFFYATQFQVEDDHLPFVRRGVPSADIIDLDYGYENSFHHTAQDTMDKLSPQSLTIVGDAFLETLRLLNQP
jgi:glutaminyl-peptide cyclotransferase